MITNYQQDVIKIYFLILCIIYFLQCVFNFILKWLITKVVTGGTGLVGKALEEIVATEEKRPDETWIFLSSKDGDLR